MGQLIRRAEKGDGAAIARIYNWYVENSNATFDENPWTPEDMEQKIALISPGYPFFVYEENGEILAYCYAHPWKEKSAYRHTWETTIYLHPASKGRGIGTKLMHMLIQACRAQECKCMIACITADNESSITFHQKFGFTKASYFKQVGYKFGKLLDVTDLQLIL